MDSKDLQGIVDRASQTFTREMRARIEALSRFLQSDAAQVALTSAAAMARDWGPILAAAVKDVEEAMDQGFPPNWSALTIPEIFKTVDLMEETGWSLCWTPPAHVLNALLAADDGEARERILLGSEAAILDDLNQMIAVVSHADVGELREAATEAVEAHRSGYFRSSQALCAAALGTVVHDHLDHGTWKAARTTFEALDPEEEGLRAFRFTALQRSLLKPTESSFPGDPPPATFNRHASAHGVSGTQYTQLNSLTANMLVASFARELSSIYALVDEQAARSGQ